MVSHENLEGDRKKDLESNCGRNLGRKIVVQSTSFRIHKGPVFWVSFAGRRVCLRPSLVRSHWGLFQSLQNLGFPLLTFPASEFPSCTNSRKDGNQGSIRSDLRKQEGGGGWIHQIVLGEARCSR